MPCHCQVVGEDPEAVSSNAPDIKENKMHLCTYSVKSPSMSLMKERVSPRAAPSRRPWASNGQIPSSFSIYKNKYQEEHWLNIILRNLFSFFNFRAIKSKGNRNFLLKYSFRQESISAFSVLVQRTPKAYEKIWFQPKFCHKSNFISLKYIVRRKVNKSIWNS